MKSTPRLTRLLGAISLAGLTANGMLLSPLRAIAGSDPGAQTLSSEASVGDRPAAASSAAAAAEPEKKEESVEDIARKLNNPVADLWSLVFQYNHTFLKGSPSEAFRGQDGLTFQPVLPLHLGKNWNLITRPVFPIVFNGPTFSRADGFGSTGGFGDIAVVSMLSPAKNTKWIWGVGPTFLFPTARLDALGQGKYQVGPAAVGLMMSKKWVVGALAQQWWSYAGEGDRPNVSQANIQYFIQRLLPNRWQVGMTPNILIDWNAKPGNQVTWPIGLGCAKTVKIGKLPVKIQLEGQYMLIHPDDFGQRFNIRLQVTPVIPPLL